MPLVVIAALAVAAALLAPGAAMAQKCEGRPGASAIQQYCEAIPEASGTGQRPGSNGRGAGGGSQGAAGAGSTQVQRELQAAGAEGAVVLGLVAASSNGDDGDSGGTGGGASDSGGSSGSGAGSSSGSSGAADPKVAEGGVLRAVSSAVSNGSTVGSGFTGLLVGMAVLAAAFGWVTLRRRHTS